MTSKRIYVAYTGGTIGMRKSAQGYVPASGFLVEHVKKHPDFQRPEMPVFDMCEYQTLMDSSNMTPANWQQIVDDIALRYTDYDGFVILHGTDTMAYTASALSFMLENLAKPVIVTGSQIPLSALRSDGQVNLLTALYLAAEHPIPEVTLFFNGQLFRGNRTTKAHADGLNAFASPNYPPLVDAGIHIRTTAQCLPIPSGELNTAKITPQPIAIVRLYPGFDAGLINTFIQLPVKAIILQSYGVGNAPSDPQLLDTLKRATDFGIVIVNLSQCFKGAVDMRGYATGKGLAASGVISGGNMTVEAALTKLHYLFSKAFAIEKIRQLIQKDLRGELDEERI